jgi:hypothetical protein
MNKSRRIPSPQKIRSLLEGTVLRGHGNRFYPALGAGAIASLDFKLLDFAADPDSLPSGYSAAAG